MLTLSIPLCLGVQASLALQKRTAPSQSPQQTHRPVSGRGSGSVGSVCVCVCVCVCMCFSDPLTHHSQFLTHAQRKPGIDTFRLSRSLFVPHSLVLPRIIVCFTIFLYSSHRTGHSVKSHMLYRIQTVLFVTFSLESVSVIYFLILIYIFLILHEASTLKKGQEYLKFYILMPALIIPLSSFIFMLKSIHYFY